MPKRKAVEPNAMPEDLASLGPIVKEFVTRMKNLENEEQLLRESKKELIEEYSDRLDVKTLKLALKMMDIRDKVEHKHYFDLFVEVLEKEEV